MFNKLDSNPKAFAIFYGTLSSILAWTILTFSPSLGEWLATSSLGILVDFVNARYVSAATLEGVNYSFFVLTALFVVFAVIWLEIMGGVKKRLRGEAKQNSDEEKLEKKEPSRLAKLASLTLINFVSPLFLLYGFAQISGEVIVLNAITDFKQHILIVTPYIDKDEKDKLLSQWSQMRTAEDYADVYKQLGAVASANNLKLYKNRMY